MSAVLIDPCLEPRVRIVADGRPPGLTWAGGVRQAPTEQPALQFGPDAELLVGPPRLGQHQLRVIAGARADPWPAGLPDPESWSTALALALAEALQGRRPLGQLTRWVDERVMATLTVSLRRRLSAAPGRRHPATAPARLRSVHLQFPAPGAIEASVHVHLAERSSAFAFRLDAWYDRWLCTALHLGPRDQEL